MGKKILFVLVVAVIAFVKGYELGHDHGQEHQNKPTTDPIEVDV